MALWRSTPGQKTWTLVGIPIKRCFLVSSLHWALEQGADVLCKQKEGSGGSRTGAVTLPEGPDTSLLRNQGLLAMYIHVCVYVYIYMYMQTCTHTYTPTYVNYTYIHQHVYIYIHMYIDTYVHSLWFVGPDLFNKKASVPSDWSPYFEPVQAST